ncbi:vegetative cell wall protein gp1-like [Homarus americanus]|uniref:vegetative cell wall protein gp1-like n=1 Tax=Homarus americanus TaxID=6706 RepID=UPI001C4399F1|nr:vegetative cell wall protein gp1-like [Homarus americanus]
MSLRVVVWCVVVMVGSYSASQKYDDHPGVPARYNYRYGVQHNPTAVDFSHQETREATQTLGEYHVMLPDGRVQVVRYTANQDGYEAQVSYKRDGLVLIDNVPAVYKPGPVSSNPGYVSSKPGSVPSKPGPVPPKPGPVPPKPGPTPPKPGPTPPKPPLASPPAPIPTFPPAPPKPIPAPPKPDTAPKKPAPAPAPLPTYPPAPVYPSGPTKPVPTHPKPVPTHPKPVPTHPKPVPAHPKPRKSQFKRPYPRPPPPPIFSPIRPHSYFGVYFPADPSSYRPSPYRP